MPARHLDNRVSGAQGGIPKGSRIGLGKDLVLRLFKAGVASAPEPENLGRALLVEYLDTGAMAEECGSAEKGESSSRTSYKTNVTVRLMDNRLF